MRDYARIFGTAFICIESAYLCGLVARAVIWSTYFAAVPPPPVPPAPSSWMAESWVAEGTCIPVDSSLQVYRCTGPIVKGRQ